MAQTGVFPCKCKSEFQDTQYGKGNRLWNYGEKILSSGGYRCTVCGATRGGPAKAAMEIKAEAKK